jgi:hypothetical protein
MLHRISIKCNQNFNGRKRPAGMTGSGGMKRFEDFFAEKKGFLLERINIHALGVH